MSKGINGVMVNLVRQTQMNKIKYNETGLSLSSYLSDPILQDLDDELIFEFTIFQLIKTLLIQSFNHSLSNFSIGISNYNSVITAFIIAVVYLAMIVLNFKRKGMINLFGIILQIPQKVFLENKLVMKIVTDNLIEK
jgi:magnesium-transporting ATPase (P-type)